MKIKKENTHFIDSRKHEQPKLTKGQNQLNKEVFDLDCKINEVVHRKEGESQLATLPVSQCCWPSTIQCRTFGCR
jgi:hypothetical protein